MKLSESDFKQIIKNTPLISIDLIVENPEGKILLGYRTNQPAQNFWFVPGGRIYKNETFANAFRRITYAELGQEFTLPDATFLGVYEHIYPHGNVFNDKQVGTTHYIVNGFKIRLKENIKHLPKGQHNRYWWATTTELLMDPTVHENTKNYFNGFKMV